MKTATEQNNYDVLCVGHAAMDLIFTVARHPGADEKMFAESFMSSGGGPAANAAVTVTRLGGKAAFLGYIGDDTFGGQLLTGLAQEQVNTDFVHRGAGATPLSVILVKPNGERSVVNYNKQVSHLDEASHDPVWLQKLQPRVILFDGHEPGVSPIIARLAREADIITVLDAGSLRPGTANLAACVDYLVCSERFALDYTQATNAQQALTLLRKVNRNVVITLGQRGLVWARGNETGAMAAFPVSAMDSTGAGDVFHGAFAFCLARQYNWPDTLRFSSAAAALCCTKIGARPGIPAFQEVNIFLEMKSGSF